MTSISQHDEESLAKLLSALPPAPEGWVEAAQELPRARKEMDDIVARAEADVEFRAAGYDIAPSLLPALRERLSA